MCVCVCVYVNIEERGGGNCLFCFCPMFCSICVSSLGYLSKPSSKAIWFDTNEIRIQIMFINHSLITIEVRSKSNGSRTPTTTNKKRASAPTHTQTHPNSHTNTQCRKWRNRRAAPTGNKNITSRLFRPELGWVRCFVFRFFMIMHEKL